MNDFYESIELTPEELKAAILEGKKKKFFHERSKERWESQEANKSLKSCKINLEKVV